MNKKILFFSVFALLTACWFSSCSKDDDEPLPEPEPVATGAPLNVMIVFAPGQLGDEGYADKVFNGIQMIESMYSRFVSDTINVSYISTYSRLATREAMTSWAEAPYNPFYGNEYQRRLLVLTEPFMIDWLDDIKDKLRPSDCVLMLKTSEKLIDEAAVSTGLGDRLYGLNISAAGSFRKFCHEADSLISWSYQDYGEVFSHDVFPIFRLYSNEEVDYQDSLYIVLQEEWGDDTQYEITPLSSNECEGIYAIDGTSITTMAYNMADNMSIYARDYGYKFSIIDIGAATTGWNYYLFGLAAKDFTCLHFDGSENTLCQFYISRMFDLALMVWVVIWMEDPENLPKMTWHGNWDGYCVDNLPEI